MRPELRPATALLAAALLALPALAFTPGQEAYKQGEQAWLSDDFATTVQKMKVALGEDSNEGLQKFKYKGLNKEDYLPHLYLGLALEKLGEKEAALASLRESRRQGIVLTSPANRRLLERALLRLEPPPTPVLPPTPTPAPFVPTPRPSPAPLPPTPVPAGPTATRAPVPLPTQRPATLTTPAVPMTAATPTPVPPPTPRPTAGAESLALQAVVKQGIRLYFSGDFDGAVRTLEPVKAFRPAARLFTAYALASKAVLSSPPDPELRKKAVLEFAQARAEGVAPLPSELLSRPVRGVLGQP